MNCPRCGEISDGACKCDWSPSSCAASQNAADPGDDSAGNEASVQERVDDDRAWRNELSDRLSRYRARRKIRPPRYPSLRLPFESTSSPARRDGSADQSLQSLEPIAESSLALDLVSLVRVQEERRHGEVPPVEESRQASADARTASAKIIEFPRFAWAPPSPPPDQLAEPVIERPRILEVPEVAPPPPALGGITIEPAQSQDPEKRPGIDFPLQSASLTKRLSAASIDGLIVAVATALFGQIFWKLSGMRPPVVQLAILIAAVPCLLWALYQYLLIVYSGRTPGLMAAGLELARFDGTRPTRSVRRWRILASYLSAASLGMGYAWVFLDEDSLCWHDRITHTYLAPKTESDEGQIIPPAIALFFTAEAQSRGEILPPSRDL